MATPNKTKITIHRYSQPPPDGLEGYIEPDNKSWILYFDGERSLFFPCRDPETGAVIGEPTASKCSAHLDTSE